MLNIAVCGTIKKVAELAEEADKVDRNLIMKVLNMLSQGVNIFIL